jgi:uncharacterized phage infection (PIP) family protein YhgE
MERNFVMETNSNVGKQSTTNASLDRVKTDTTEVVEKAKTAGREQLESGKQAAATQAEKVADVIGQASSQLKENNLQTLADYTTELAAGIKNFSEGLQNRSVDELVTDIRDMARRNPTAFILGSVVVGIGISRFFKASAERRQQTINRETQTRDRQYNESDPSFGDYE